MTLAADGRISEAAAAYREALLLHPDHAQAHQGLRALPRPPLKPSSLPFTSRDPSWILVPPETSARR